MTLIARSSPIVLKQGQSRPSLAVATSKAGASEMDGSDSEDFAEKDNNPCGVACKYRLSTELLLLLLICVCVVSLPLGCSSCRVYKLFDLKNYNLMYSIRDPQINEMKISPGNILLIMQRDGDRLPLRILSIEDGIQKTVRSWMRPPCRPALNCC